MSNTEEDKARLLKKSLQALEELADASEEYVSADPSMPSYPESEERFEAALESARRVITISGAWG